MNYLIYSKTDETCQLKVEVWKKTKLDVDLFTLRWVNNEPAWVPCVAKGTHFETVDRDLALDVADRMLNGERNFSTEHKVTQQEALVALIFLTNRMLKREHVETDNQALRKVTEYVESINEDFNEDDEI